MRIHKNKIFIKSHFCKVNKHMIQKHFKTELTIHRLLGHIPFTKDEHFFMFSTNI